MGPDFMTRSASFESGTVPKPDDSNMRICWVLYDNPHVYTEEDMEWYTFDKDDRIALSFQVMAGILLS